MSTEQNKEILRGMFDRVVSGDTRDVAKIFAPDWVNLDPGLPPMMGLEGARQLLTIFSTAFPDCRFNSLFMVGEGDKVAAHFSFSGTHQGAFLNIPPTGRSINVSGTGIFRFKDGKLVENRVVFDALGLMQQLGIVPTP